MRKQSQENHIPIPKKLAKFNTDFLIKNSKPRKNVREILTGTDAPTFVAPSHGFFLLSWQVMHYNIEIRFQIKLDEGDKFWLLD